MKKLLSKLSIATLAFMPFLAAAQDETFKEIGTFFTNISGFINTILIPLVFALALLFFLFGAFRYFIAGGADPTKRAEGTKLMIYSVVGFVLMVSIFGIVNIIANGLGFSDKGKNLDNIPSVPTRTNSR